MVTDVPERDLSEILVPLPPSRRAKDVRSVLAAVVRSGKRVCYAAASWRKAQDGAAKEERRKRKRERKKERGLVKKAKVARDQLAAKRPPDDGEGEDEEEEEVVAAAATAAAALGDKRPAGHDASDDGVVDGSRKRAKASPPSAQPQAMSPRQTQPSLPPRYIVKASPSFIEGRPGFVKELFDQCNIEFVPTAGLPHPVSLLVSSRDAVVVATTEIPSISRAVIGLRTTRLYDVIHVVVDCPCLGGEGTTASVADLTALHNSIGDSRNGDCVTVMYSRAGSDSMLMRIVRGLTTGELRNGG